MPVIRLQGTRSASLAFLEAPVSSWGVQPAAHAAVSLLPAACAPGAAIRRMHMVLDTPLVIRYQM